MNPNFISLNFMSNESPNILLIFMGFPDVVIFAFVAGFVDSITQLFTVETHNYHTIPLLAGG